MLFYALTIFLSAFLLFQVQPMIAKMILPWFGGGAAVWATCLLFFQAVLLAGYGYSHGLINRLKPKQQWMLHAALLVAAIAVLPIAPDASWKPADPGAPQWKIIALLAVTIGLPYFLLSTTGPLIQAWFVQANPGATPYRLFALSNLGSMLALLSYPPLIEPYLSLRHQSWIWSGLFALFAALCIYTGRRSYHGAKAAEATDNNEAPPKPSLAQHLFWIALAAVPSMLLLTVTAHLSMDLAPIPFLWIAPLALYLLTFILCFESERGYPRVVLLTLLIPALVLMLYLVELDHSDRPSMPVTIAEFCTAFFIACMVCHGELARLKPHPRHLTGFYLMVSIGGAVGGVFVALIAPSLFNAYYEFPVALVLCAAVAMIAVYREKSWPFRKDLLGWPSIAAMTMVAILTGYAFRIMRDSIAGSMLVARNFYGELRVKQHGPMYEWESYRSLVHGTINHGEQYTHPARRQTPVSYYCADSGIGLWMGQRVVGNMQKVGVFGLGAGTLAVYARPGDLYRFYEINPLVPEIANQFFTYLKDAEGAVEVSMGDARLSLERQQPQNFDLLAMDAFSSDSVPVHLLTREAMQLYFRHLKPDGVLAVHISNRYINLQPVLARVAAELGRKAVMVETEDNKDGSCYGTTWVLIGNHDSVLQRIALRPHAQDLPDAPWMKTWTDDYTNVFKVLK